jgi:hypothetical protein
MRNKVVIIILISIVLTKAFGQKKIELPDGNSILLKSDKTWSYIEPIQNEVKFGSSILNGKPSFFSIKQCESYALNKILIKIGVYEKNKEYCADEILIVDIHIINNSSEDMLYIKNDFEFKFPTVDLIKINTDDFDPIGLGYSDDQFLNNSIEGYNSGDIIIAFWWNKQFDRNKLSVRYRKNGTNSASIYYRTSWYLVSDIVNVK